MTKTKRTLALMLALILVFGAVPAFSTVFAADTVRKGGKEGSAEASGDSA